MFKLKPYPEYKESGLPWLGKIPSGWRTVPAFAAFRERHEKNVGLRETQVLSLSYGRIVKKHEDALHGLVPASFETYQIIEPGNIILRFTDLQNDQRSLRVGLASDRGIITSAYVCLGVCAGLMPDYAYYLLHAADVQKVFYGMGAGLRQSLGFGDLRRMPIATPPLDEQRRIVRFLRLTGMQTEKLIRAKRKVIELLNEQKQAIIHRAVTRGFNNVRLKASGIEWLGDVPAHWEILALKRVLHRLIDCEHKTAPAVESSEFRVVRTSAVRNGMLRLQGTYCTDAESFERWTQRGLPQPGDVIFTREAPAGEACVVPSTPKVCLGQRTVLLQLDRAVYDPRFLVHMIYAGPTKLRILLASQGSTVGHFNVDDIGWMTIYKPPLNEQESIVRWIEQETKGLDATIDRSEREIELLREYRTRLIADVVTGKLDVRGVALPEIEEAEASEPLSDVADEELDDSGELVAAEESADAD